jgi:L-lactate dehydrogenase
MKRQVAIIGTGWVGSSVAISTLHLGVADELLLHDVREAVAQGEAMDLAHGATFYPPAAVRTAAIEDMVDADVIVIAAGRGGRPGTCSGRMRHLSATSADNSSALAAPWSS